MLESALKHTSVYAIIGIISQASFFLLWIFLGLLLPTKEIGIYALVMFAVDLFATINLFGLDTALTKYYYTHENRPLVFGTILKLFVVASIFAGLCFLGSLGYLHYVVKDASSTIYQNVILFLSLIVTNALVNLCLDHYSTLHKSHLYAVLQVIKTISFIGFSLFLVLQHKNILAILSAYFFSNLLVIIYFFSKERKEFNLTTPLQPLAKEIFHYAFPIMLYGILGVLYLYLGRIILDYYAALSLLGVYSFFLVIVLQVNGFWGAFNRAWTPEVFKSLSNREGVVTDYIVDIVYLLSLIYLIFYLLFIIIGHFLIFRFVFRPEYLLHINLFYILMLAPLFTGIYTITYPLYYYGNKTKIILWVNVITLILNSILLFTTIHYLGAVGAALTFLLISIIDPMLYFLFFKGHAKLPIALLTFYSFLGLVTIIATVVFLFSNSLVLLSIPLIFFCTGIITLKEVKPYLSEIKKLVFHG